MPATTTRDVILDILRLADGEWTGKTRLVKAIYFAHLYYAAENPGLLTDCQFARLPHGPSLDHGSEFLQELARSELIAIERRRFDQRRKRRLASQGDCRAIAVHMLHYGRCL